MVTVDSTKVQTFLFEESLVIEAFLFLSTQFFIKTDLFLLFLSDLFLFMLSLLFKVLPLLHFSLALLLE
jgi:hypothetical protein